MHAAREITIFGAALLLLVSGCKHDGEASAHADAASDGGVDTATPSSPKAKRYDDESDLHGVLDVVRLDDTAALDAVPKGNVLATLKSGTPVTELAARDGFVLVANSLNAGNPVILGWIPKFAMRDRSAFDAGKQLVSPHCDPSMQSVFQDAPRCAYACTSDRECRDQGICDSAIVLPASGDLPKTLTFTAVCTARPDAGAPIENPKLVPSLFGSPHRMDGSCSSGFATAPSVGKLCYRSCKADRDCPSNAACKEVGAAKLCTAN